MGWTDELFATVNEGIKLIVDQSADVCPTFDLSFILSRVSLELFNLIKEQHQRTAIVLANFLGETAFLVIDRRGQIEGHAATFVFCSISSVRKEANVDFSSICNCFQ